MKRHLNENQITDALLGMADEGARAHLESCSECLQKVEAASTLLSGFGKDARREAEREDAFWARQGLAIMERSSADIHPANRGSLRLNWGMAAATGVVVFLLLGVVARFEDPAPAVEKPMIASEYENDELLLRHVEAALERRTPMALAPAEVLTRELHRRAKPAGSAKQVSVTQN